MTGKDKRVEEALLSRKTSFLKKPFHTLRRMAERISPDKIANPLETQQPLSLEESQQLIVELQTHQIELEMQNEDLRRIQVELEAARARYFTLYDLAPVG